MILSQDQIDKLNELGVEIVYESPLEIEYLGSTANGYLAIHAIQAILRIARSGQNE